MRGGDEFLILRRIRFLSLLSSAIDNTIQFTILINKNFWEYEYIAKFEKYRLLYLVKGHSSQMTNFTNLDHKVINTFLVKLNGWVNAVIPKN